MCVLFRDEGDGVEAEVVLDGALGDVEDGDHDHGCDEREQQQTGELQRRIRCGGGAVVGDSARPLRERDQSDREDRRQTCAEDQPDGQDLENCFQISHFSSLCLVPDQTEAVGWSTTFLRSSAGTTELLVSSQSALTLLWSTFCCWARQYMKPDSPTRMTKM